MKKLVAQLLACVVTCGVITSCGNGTESKTVEPAFSFATLGDAAPADSSTTPAKPPVAPSTDTVFYGLDISSYQGNLVTLLNSGTNLHFIFCKATQGITYTDPDFRTNWNTITQKGFIRGAYHFYMCDDDPVAQARHFAGQIEDIQPGDMAPVLDIEQGSMTPTTNATQMQNDILTFLTEVQKLTGRQPIIYTDYAFANQYLKQSALQNYDLWLAEYSGAAQPKVPVLWKNKGYKIWQRSDSYSIDSEQTDYDVYYGSLNDLVKN